MKIGKPNSINNTSEKDLRFSVLTEWNPNPIIEISHNLKVSWLNLAARMKFPDLDKINNAHPVFEGLNETMVELLESGGELVVFERECTIDDIIYEQQIIAIPKSQILYLFMTDMTKRIQAERERRMLAAQLLQAQKLEAIGHLTDGIAHDFNNILTVIQGQLQLFLKESDHNPRNEPGLKRVNAALEATVKAADLSKRLLAFSRQECIKPQVIDIPSFMNSLVKLLEVILTKSIKLELNIEPNVWKVFVDPGQLENVVINLAVNARDAMPAKRQDNVLCIEAHNVNLSEGDLSLYSDVVPGEYLKITIRDNGTGIPKDILPNIFKPFFTTKAVGKGTGLGLSQTNDFIKNARGHITIETKENVGTSIHLFLPRIPDKNEVKQSHN